MTHTASPTYQYSVGMYKIYKETSSYSRMFHNTHCQSYKLVLVMLYRILIVFNGHHCVTSRHCSAERVGSQLCRLH